MHLARTALVLVLALGACGPATEPQAEVPIGTEPGLRAPTLAGSLPDGAPFQLAEAERSATVVVFYRTAECGLCRLQLDRLQEHLPAYERLDATVVAVTLDTPEQTLAMFGPGTPAFPVVSVDSSTFRDWGVMDPQQSTPLPATYVIDGEGLVRFRHIGRNASDRTSDAEMVAVLETLPLS